MNVRTRKSKGRRAGKPEATRVVRVAEAGAMLSVSPTTIRRWCTKGLLPYGIIEGQRRIRVADIDRLIELGMRGKL